MARTPAREALIKYGFVIPSTAGIRDVQVVSGSLPSRGRLNQRFPRPSWRRSAQRGQVLLGIVIILGIVFGALFYTFVSPANSTAERDKITNAALAQARDALIGYAAGQKNGAGNYRPGELPCPAVDINGDEASSCDNPASRIGRLPWKKLGLPDPRDGAGERLWYAVSGTFKNASQTGILNSDTTGDFTVTGLTPASNVIAIVFAPGAAIGTQRRDAANISNIANYLDEENANGDTIFTTAPTSDTFNDKLMLITSDNFFPAVTMRVASEARSFLQAYFTANGYYPFANDYSDPSFNCTLLRYSGRIPVGNLSNPPCSLINWDGAAFPPWFVPNNWHQLVFYAVAPACTAPSSSCLNMGGFLTVNGTPAPNNDKPAIVIVTGRGLSGQSRPCASVADCVEDAENTNGNNVFVKPVLSPANNDRLVIVSP